MTAKSAAALQKGRNPRVQLAGKTQSQKPNENPALAASDRAAVTTSGTTAAIATSRAMVGIKAVVGNSSKVGGDPTVPGSKGIAPEEIGSGGKTAALMAEAAGQARAALGETLPAMSATMGATGADPVLVH